MIFADNEEIEKKNILRSAGKAVEMLRLRSVGRFFYRYLSGNQS